MALSFLETEFAQCHFGEVRIVGAPERILLFVEAEPSQSDGDNGVVLVKVRDDDFRAAGQHVHRHRFDPVNEKLAHGLHHDWLDGKVHQTGAGGDVGATGSAGGAHGIDASTACGASALAI